MSLDRAAQTLALRVLERWCLVGDEPMEGDQWDTMCDLAGVDPQSFAQRAQGLRDSMSPEECKARAARLAENRSRPAGGSGFGARNGNETEFSGPVQPGSQRHTKKHLNHD